LDFLDKTDILSQHYITSRYPIEYPPADRPQVEEAFRIAKEVIDFIKSKIKQGH